MKTGLVKWFSNNKGYGFIKPTDGGDDVFVFYPTIEQDGYKSLSTGQQVRYESISAPQGQMTTRVLI